jgi:hypothetical protein
MEMPARDAERWGRRMLNAMTKSGYPIFEALNFSAGSMAALATLGIGVMAAADVTLAEPLHDEMLDRCVARVTQDGRVRGTRVLGFPDPIGKLLDEDIEEVATLLFLRNEVFELHTGFSFAAKLSPKFNEFLAAMNQPSTTTQMSEDSSALSSQVTAQAS